MNYFTKRRHRDRSKDVLLSDGEISSSGSPIKPSFHFSLVPRNNSVHFYLLFCFIYIPAFILFITNQQALDLQDARGKRKGMMKNEHGLGSDVSFVYRYSTVSVYDASN